TTLTRGEQGGPGWPHVKPSEATAKRTALRGGLKAWPCAQPASRSIAIKARWYTPARPAACAGPAESNNRMPPEPDSARREANNGEEEARSTQPVAGS